MPETGKIRAHLVVSGRVQGVMFRKHAQKEARGLGVCGWVKNSLDGTVEMVAEGKKENVEQFIVWCRKGPQFAKVEKLDITLQEHKGEFMGFDIREFGF